MVTAEKHNRILREQEERLGERIEKILATNKDLLKYVDHYGTCTIKTSVCDCGLNELLKI